MDEAHPITLFLSNFGYWIRGTAIGLILCLMLKTGFLSFGSAEAATASNTLYLGVFTIGLTSPFAGQWAFAPFWQKITPIKDRITYFENEIVFVGSTLISVSTALFFWGFVPISKALTVTAWAILAASPLFFLIWLTKSTLTPLKYKNTSDQVAAAQNFRDETPYFWKNALAYLITALVSSLMLTLMLMLVIIMRGGQIQLGTGCLSFGSLIMMNLIAAPIYIWIGRKIKPQDHEPKGLHYSLGAITFLTVIVVLNIPVIFRSTFKSGQMIDMQAVLNAWPFGVAYGLIVMSYIAGGFVFSKSYKPRPPALEFA